MQQFIDVLAFLGVTLFAVFTMNLTMWATCLILRSRNEPDPVGFARFTLTLIAALNAAVGLVMVIYGSVIEQDATLLGMAIWDFLAAYIHYRFIPPKPPKKRRRRAPKKAPPIPSWRTCRPQWT